STKTFNNVDSLDEDGRGIDIDSQGAIVVAGSSGSTVEGAGILLRKYTPALELMWTRIINGPAGVADEGLDVAVNSADEVYVVGAYRSDLDSDIFVRRYSP